MGDSWIELLDHVLRPARPELARGSIERGRHLAQRLEFQEQRAREIAVCVLRIDEARREVFAADDGVVGTRMTDLEREWRRLTHLDPEAGLMDLWARLVAKSSIDRKRWRDSTPSRALDALIALAADEAGVLAAEAAVEALSLALARHGVNLGRRVRFRIGERDRDTLSLSALLAEPRRVASERCRELKRARALEFAASAERQIVGAALARFPERPDLAEELGQAAFVDRVWPAAELGAAENPASALRALWQTGYVLLSAESDSVTLEIPALPA